MSKTASTLQGALAHLLPPGRRIDTATEASDLTLMQPGSAAEHILLQQLQRGRQHNSDRDGRQHHGAEQPAQLSQKGQAFKAAGRQQISDWAAGCSYTTIPAHVTPRSGCGAAELTASNLDKSGLLQQLYLQRTNGEETLLAELQLAYISFFASKSLAGAHPLCGMMLLSPQEDLSVVPVPQCLISVWLRNWAA